MEAHPALTKIRNSCLGTRIYSFFARRKAERQQFQYDMVLLLVSLKFRQRNWRHHYPFDITNTEERMSVWIANGGFGLSFKVKDRVYGGVTHYSVITDGRTGWRRKVLRAAREAAKSPWVEKYGLQWKRLIDDDGA